MPWIQSKSGLLHNLPQILTKTAQQQQAQPSLQHPSKSLDSSKLKHHLVQQVCGSKEVVLTVVVVVVVLTAVGDLW